MTLEPSISNNAALQVNAISAGYVRGMPIIEQVSLRSAPGEIVCIVGPNGAGKSTLLKAIAGLLRIEHGHILLGDTDITGLRTDKLTQSGVAFVPQLDNIFRSLSIEQNLALAARRCKGHQKQRSAAMLDLFPLLKSKYKTKAGALSGGQRQLLAIAMALIAEPDLLLLDEPSAGLSPKATNEVLGMLQGIADSHVGIVMVEQNVKAALRVSGRAYVMAEGRNQHEGKASELLSGTVLADIYLGLKGKESHAAKSV